MQAQQLNRQEISQLKRAVKGYDLDARAFFFKKAVTSYLDSALDLKYVGYSIEDLFPALPKRLVKEVVARLEADKPSLNGKRDEYIESLWSDFAFRAKIALN